MADTTPIYGWPYQEATDPPDGAALGQELAEAIETTVDSLDDRLDAAETAATALTTRVTNLESGGPVQAVNGDNGSGFTSGTPSNGTTNCGVAFTAPASGSVLVWAQGSISLASGTGQFWGGPRVRTGATVGSGSDVYDPSAIDPGIRFGSSVAATLNGAAIGLVTGLTPGDSYNVCFVVWVQAGSSPSLSYFGRQVGAMAAPA